MPEYVDYAEYYDQSHIITKDIQFYLEYAKQTGGPVLELACGTGRVLIPIADAGIRIHGLDLSVNMLKIAEKKISERCLNNLATLSLGNMADFDLAEKNFSMAFIAVRSFMHLFTQREQLQCLKCIHEHLRKDGLLLMDLYSPNFVSMARYPEKVFTFRKEFWLPNGNKVIEKRRFLGVDTLNQIFMDEILFEEYVDETQVRVRQVPLYTRFTFHYELELLLSASGFSVQEIFRDYDKAPYDGTGEIIVVVKKK